jgi:hypothetical protein
VAHLTQRELAEFVGAAEVSVHRAVRRLARQGLVRTGHRCIAILDGEGLTRIGYREYPHRT